MTHTAISQSTRAARIGIVISTREAIAYTWMYSVIRVIKAYGTVLDTVYGYSLKLGIHHVSSLLLMRARIYPYNLCLYY